MIFPGDILSWYQTIRFFRIVLLNSCTKLGNIYILYWYVAHAFCNTEE